MTQLQYNKIVDGVQDELRISGRLVSDRLNEIAAHLSIEALQHVVYSELQWNVRWQNVCREELGNRMIENIVLGNQ